MFLINCMKDQWITTKSDTRSHFKHLNNKFIRNSAAKAIDAKRVIRLVIEVQQREPKQHEDVSV